MEILRLVLLYAHLIGFALLLGAAVAQYFTGTVRINRPMLWGALLALAAGVALAAPIRDEADQSSYVKLAVKLVIGLMIAIMVWIPRKRPEVNRGHFLGVIGLTLGNAAIAVFW